MADTEVHRIKKVKYTNEDVITSIAKAAKMKPAKVEVGQVNTLYGTISDDPRNTGCHSECFLPDTGATINIIGLEVAKDNQLRITKLKAARRIVEAPRNRDIIKETFFM